MTKKPIIALFLDIGGVLLTNGWSRDLRKLGADQFGLDYEEMDERHHLTFGTYEEGKLGLDKYTGFESTRKKLSEVGLEIHT